MYITIAERLRPFSHLPGTSFVLPGSSLNLQIYPTLIRVSDLSASTSTFLADITIDLEGPVDGFTSLLDLEKGNLHVFGNTARGYFRYFVKAVDEGQRIAIDIKKAPQNGIFFLCAGKWSLKTNASVHAGETIIFFNSTQVEASSQVEPSSFVFSERLSLGSHKKQDWELILRRLSFADIFPIWHRLGQMISSPISPELAGVSELLIDCKKAIENRAPEKILSAFKKVFLAGFSGVLSPRLIDTEHQGIPYPELDLMSHQKASAITLLKEGSKLIRSLFIHETANGIHVLPSLPPEFHCGRMIYAKCIKQGVISMEWTKKSVRSMTFQASENQISSFSFSNHERKCRLRHSNKDRGILYIPGSEIDIVAGQHYWFDNFER